MLFGLDLGELFLFCLFELNYKNAYLLHFRDLCFMAFSKTGDLLLEEFVDGRVFDLFLGKRYLILGQ